MIREGDKRKSVLTGRVYEVKTVNDWFVLLESRDGASRVWTETDNLKLFYEKVEEGWTSDDGLKKSDSPTLQPNRLGH